MSVLSYTFADLKSAAGHAAAKVNSSGKTAFDTGNTTAQVVNAALDALARAHPWTWRKKYTTLSDHQREPPPSTSRPTSRSSFGCRGSISPYATKRFRPVNGLGDDA
jgi:hypothetical protein